MVLYEMATGKRPFHDTSGPQVIGAMLEQPPSPPSSRNQGISPALESIIVKAIDKDPERRYQSARELRIDLERLGTGAVPLATRRTSSRRWIAGLGALLLLVLAAGIYRPPSHLLPQPHPPPAQPLPTITPRPSPPLPA